MKAKHIIIGGAALGLAGYALKKWLDDDGGGSVIYAPSEIKEEVLEDEGQYLCKDCGGIKQDVALKAIKAEILKKWIKDKKPTCECKEYLCNKCGSYKLDILLGMENGEEILKSLLQGGLPRYECECETSEEHSSLGNHSADFENFEGSQTSSLASPSKFSKNYERHTANIGMLGGEDSNVMESVESNLDSSFSKDSNSLDSTLCVESSKINSVCGTHPKEASSGERESVREGEGSDFAIQAPSPSLENGRLENGSLVEDSKELKDSSLDSRILDKDSSIKSNLDSKVSTNSLESNTKESYLNKIEELIESKEYDKLATLLQSIKNAS